MRVSFSPLQKGEAPMHKNQSHLTSQIPVSNTTTIELKFGARSG